MRMESAHKYPSIFTSTHPRTFLLACILSLCAAFPAIAAESEETELVSGPTLLIYFENDLFYNEDRYYTNAVQARLISPDLRELAENGFLPDGLSRQLSRVPFPGRKSATQYNISVGVGQHIYTPKDTQVTTLQKDDRPYAGYLYGLLALHAKQEDRLDTLELAAGVIGPSALSKQSQNEVHRIRDIDTAKGWKHQLRDEPALMLTWTRVWRLKAPLIAGKFGWDILPRIGASAGTPYTRAGFGGEARLGWNLPNDFGSSTIRPGSGINRPAGDVAANPLPAKKSGNSLLDNVSIYIFGGADGQAVWHNTFLDGNLWKDSHSVDKFPLAGELSWGIATNIHGFHISYTHVYRAKEFHGQSREQNFGSITVGYRF